MNYNKHPILKFYSESLFFEFESGLTTEILKIGEQGSIRF